MRPVAYLAAIALCLVPVGLCQAGEPAEVLPEGTFATGEGCAALAKSPPEDIEMMDFMVLSNTELMGQDFVCSFTEAGFMATNSGKAWLVKAKCESGAPAVASTISIKQLAEEKLEVSMTSEEGERDDLGTFVYCPDVLTD